MKFDIKEEDMIIKPYNTPGPIYIREQKGFYQQIRRNLGWLLMLMFIAIPWIQYKGEQAVVCFVFCHELAWPRVVWLYLPPNNLDVNV